MQQCMYLVGTFGISLFLMVNGYLLCDRDLSFLYIRLKIIRYVKFMLQWIGIIEIEFFFKI